VGVACERTRRARAATRGAVSGAGASDRGSDKRAAVRILRSAAAATFLLACVACDAVREQLAIHDRVLLIRLFSVLLASLSIPFTFLAAWGGALGSFAVYVAGPLAVAPGLVIDAAHVANDGLALGVAAIFLWLMTREKTSWNAAGTVLGAAILAKASLLVLAPVLIVLWCPRPKQMGLALTLGFAIGGWWYARNVLTGMPLTGWQESVPLTQIAASAVALFHHGGWINEAYTIAKSFTWFGAWSFITLRTWMYMVLEVLAFTGMLAGFRKQGLRAPRTVTVTFTIAIIGGAAAYYAVHNVAGIPGWYLWPSGGAMALTDLRSRRANDALLCGPGCPEPRFHLAVYPRRSAITHTHVACRSVDLFHRRNPAAHASVPREHANVIDIQSRREFCLAIRLSGFCSSHPKTHRQIERLVRNAVIGMKPVHAIDTPGDFVFVPLHAHDVKSH
jgi:hypothetical protein